jgi:hypothetical protein
LCAEAEGAELMIEVFFDYGMICFTYKSGIGLPFLWPKLLKIDMKFFNPHSRILLRNDLQVSYKNIQRFGLSNFR